MAYESKWPTLPSDLLSLILNRLSVFEFIRCRLVCTSWRSAVAKAPPPTQTCTPLLFLSDSDPNFSNMFSLTVQNLFRVHLPQIARFHSFIGASHGWLASADADRIHLINPLTGAHLPLPPCPAIRQAKLESPRLRHNDLLYGKVLVFSLPPTSMITFVIHRGLSNLAFIRVGDEAWTDLTPLSTPNDLYSFTDIVRYNGQFYALRGCSGEVVALDVSMSPPRLRVTDISHQFSIPMSVNVHRQERYLVESMINDDDWPDDLPQVCRYVKGHRQEHYLVESMINDADGPDELLQVCRYVRSEEGCLDETTSYFEVYRLDNSSHDDSKWVPVERLKEGTAIFLGKSLSMTVSVKDSPEVKENCIYFTAPRMRLRGTNPNLRDMGVFSLEDGRIEHFFGCPPLCDSNSPWIKGANFSPFWFVPNLS